MASIGDLAMLFAGLRIRFDDDELQKRIGFLLNLLILCVWTSTIVIGMVELHKKIRKLIFGCVVLNAVGFGTAVCFAVLNSDVAVQLGELVAASVARHVQDVCIAAAPPSDSDLPITNPASASLPTPTATPAAAPSSTSVAVTSTSVSSSLSVTVHEEIEKAIRIAATTAELKIVDVPPVAIDPYIQSTKVYSFPPPPPPP